MAPGWRFLGSLLIALALVSPARSQGGQDGPRDAATAQQAAQALSLYLDAVLKSGGRPDYAKAPAAELFRRVFDSGQLAALPQPQADDMSWMLAWGGAVDQAYKRVMLFGPPPGQAIDQITLQRNMAEYEDQHAAAIDFMLRFQARLTSTMLVFIDELPSDQRTPARAAGFQQARAGAAQMITGAIISIAQGMKPANARLMSGALRDTRGIWAEYLQPDDRSQIAGMLRETARTQKDDDVQRNLAALDAALAAAR